MSTLHPPEDDHNDGDTSQDSTTNDSGQGDAAVRRGSAGGVARARQLSGERRREIAASASAARWEGGDLPANQAESVGRAVLSGWAARADLDVAHPSRGDIGVDEIVTPADLSWMAPIQLKTVARDGITVYRKYTQTLLLLVYVILGREDGGLESRDHTRLVVIEPDVAYGLPTRLGMAWNPASGTYRWPSITRDLNAALEPYTARDPGKLVALLAEMAPLRYTPPESTVGLRAL